MGKSWTAEAIGPRETGGRYRSYYWGNEYLVVHVGRTPEGSRIPWSDWSIACQDDDGTIRTHCTPWDERDTIIFDARD